ncbi:MAG TPA: hypothetical protein VGK10_12660 [Prolixibacteraceae bacterium]
MKNLSILLLLCLFLITMNVKAQELISDPQNPVSMPRTIDRTSFGIGGGFDYGGFGANILIYPQENIGLFGGVGYALAGIGYNVGAKFRIVSRKHHTDPFAMVMYGYNAAIAVKDGSQFNKLFYGPSLGIGLDLHSKKSNKGYWSFAVLAPIRGSEVNEYIDDLETNHGVAFQNELPPIAVSIGYRFVLN